MIPNLCGRGFTEQGMLVWIRVGLVKEHSEHSQTRIGAILRELGDDLKQNPDNQNSDYANQFLEGSLEQ